MAGYDTPGKVNPTVQASFWSGPEGENMKERFQFIVYRLQFVCAKVGMTFAAGKQFFPHLTDFSTFERILPTHERVANEILQIRGAPVFIDHTILAAGSTAIQVKALCGEAKEHGFGAVCVNGGRVPLALQCLEGSNVNVAAVVGFPLGAMSSLAKRKEAKALWQLGCQELDMVIDVGRMKDGDYIYVMDQIHQLAEDSAQYSVQKKVLKVILETCLLEKSEIVDAAILCVLAGATCVKTSTGFSTSGATSQDVVMMRLTVGNHIGVKASGGIRDYETMQQMINAGASLVGTSSGVTICKNVPKNVTVDTFPRRFFDHCSPQ